MVIPVGCCDAIAVRFCFNTNLKANMLVAIITERTFSKAARRFIFSHQRDNNGFFLLSTKHTNKSSDIRINDRLLVYVLCEGLITGLKIYPEDRMVAK